MAISSKTLLWIFLTLAFIPLLGQYVNGRFQAIQLMIRNSPSKLPRVAAFKNYETKFADRLRNCEDALMVDELGLAIISCDPGRDGWNTVMAVFARDRVTVPNGELFVFRYYSSPDDEQASASALTNIELDGYPGSDDFHPLGIEYHHESRTLFVVNHHLDGNRVEVFELKLVHGEGGGPTKATAKHRRTVIHPLIQTPNAIVAMPEGGGKELLVTNDHYFQARNNWLLSSVESYLAIPGGTVVHVDLGVSDDDDKEVKVRVLARVPFANGIAAFNESSIAVASSTTPAVLIYDVTPASEGCDPTLNLRRTVKAPFLVDNISVDGNGVLLMAGHPHPPTLERAARGRPKCLELEASVVDPKRMPEGCRRSLAPSWVAEWTAESGVRDLYVMSGGFGSSSTAVRDVGKGVGVVTGLYEAGLMVWRE